MRALVVQAVALHLMMMMSSWDSISLTVRVAASARNLGRGRVAGVGRFGQRGRFKGQIPTCQNFAGVRGVRTGHTRTRPFQCQIRPISTLPVPGRPIFDLAKQFVARAREPPAAGTGRKASLRALGRAFLQAARRRTALWTSKFSKIYRGSSFGLRKTGKKRPKKTRCALLVLP